MGTSGIAFKCQDKYTTRFAILNNIPDMWVLRSWNTSCTTNNNSRQILACAKAAVHASNQVVDIEILAVKPNYQVTALIHYHENRFKFHFDN